MFCSKCGNRINDEAVICPNCGCPTQNYNYLNQTTYQQLHNLGRFKYSEPVNNFSFYLNYEKDISNAKTLALIAIIVGIFIPLVGWICGGIGISKCNKVLLLYLNNYNANNVKKLNIIGIAVSSVIFAISLVIEFLVIMLY